MWNVNHKSQKRPVQLNSTLLHKELIKVTLRRRTKLFSTERENVQARLRTSCKEGTLLRLRLLWKCCFRSAPSQQLIESTSNHHDCWDQQFRVLEVPVPQHSPPQETSAPMFLLSAVESSWKRVTGNGYVFARAGAAGTSFTTEELFP